MRDDIFIIPRDSVEGEYIIYAPLQNKAFLCNEKTAYVVNKYIQGDNLLKNEQDAIVGKYIGYIESSDKLYPNSKMVGSENCAVIILSQRCNLACSYCYAQEVRSNDTIEKDKLKLALDYILSQESHNVEFVFIGGGEPFVTWGLLKWSLDYIQRNKKIRL